MVYFLAFISITRAVLIVPYWMQSEGMKSSKEQPENVKKTLEETKVPKETVLHEVKPEVAKKADVCVDAEL